MAATMKALVRKLLIKVHPDVVASQSDKFRTHNEKALKALLSCIDEHNKNPSFTEKSPSIFFYLREGGKTSNVKLDYARPERTVRELLGLPKLEEDTTSEKDKRMPSKEAMLNANKYKLTKEEMARIFNEAMENWWASREANLSEIDLLFKQNRIRFAPDGLDLNASVDVDLDRLEIKQAVELAKEAFEFHVEESTAQALQHPSLMNAAMVIVARNLDEIVRNDETLYLPLETPPEVFGAEIDSLVDSLVERAMHEQIKSSGDTNA